MSAANRARIEARDEAEFSKWEKLAEKMRERQGEESTKNDLSSIARHGKTHTGQH